MFFREYWPIGSAVLSWCIGEGRTARVARRRWTKFSPSAGVLGCSQSTVDEKSFQEGDAKLVNLMNWYKVAYYLFRQVRTVLRVRELS
jgi:hypothetical protein